MSNNPARTGTRGERRAKLAALFGGSIGGTEEGKTELEAPDNSRRSEDETEEDPPWNDNDITLTNEIGDTTLKTLLNNSKTSPHRDHQHANRLLVRGQNQR